MTVAPSEPTTTTGSATGALSTFRARVRSRLGIDPRALGAFRIGLGLVIVFDLLFLRAPGLGTFYTDAGVFPRSALAETAPSLEQWSLYAVSGSIWVQALLLGITVAVATCLLIGYRPRLAAVGSALLLASLHARNPYLVNGGDTILISLLLFAAFLPLDARWSLRGRHRSDDGRIVSVATATVLLHVVGIYAINAVLKFESDAWMSGVAVRRILHLEDFRYLLGPIVAEYPAVLTAINWLWIAVLSASVLLVFATGWLRAATVVAFITAHLGMAATMRLGAFPFVMSSVLLLFLPPRAWDHVDRRIADSGLPSRLDFAPGRTAGPTRFDAVGSPSVRRGARLAAAALLVCGLVSLVGWQLVAAGLVEPPSSEEPATLEGSSWAFFAPDPPDSYSWYVVEAERESGPAIDLVDGEAVDFDRPPNAMDRYPTTLWKRYGTKAQGTAVPFQSAAAYVCERSPADVESVTIYRVEQRVTADGSVGDPLARERAAAVCE